MYFWTLPGPEGAVLGGAAVAVETSLTIGCTLGTVVVTGEVVVEPEPGAEVLRDRTWEKKESQYLLPSIFNIPWAWGNTSLAPTEYILRALLRRSICGLLGPWEVVLLALGPEGPGLYSSPPPQGALK